MSARGGPVDSGDNGSPPAAGVPAAGVPAAGVPAVDEFALIYRYFSGLGAGDRVELGLGDDCAILRLPTDQRLAVSVDTLVEGVHFPLQAFPEDIGFRAVAVAASDLAAMGAAPLGMSLALTMPAADELWLHAFSQGVGAAASACQLPLVGGDTTRGPLTISVQVFGTLPAGQGLLRSGAKVGDGVFVSGPLGDAAAALAVYNGEWEADSEHLDYLDQRFYRPLAQLDLGRQLLGLATAAIDISDGLIADAGHIADASGVCMCIDPAQLPLSPALASHARRDTALGWALSGGDDYQLCFTLPAGETAPVGCTRIGEVCEGAGVDCGRDFDKDFDNAGGYRHF